MRTSYDHLGIAGRRYAHSRYRRLGTGTSAEDASPRLPREQPNEGERYAPIELSPEVARHLERVDYEGGSPLQGRVHRIKNWEAWPMERKIAFLRAFVEDTSRDPAIAQKAVAIVRTAGIKVRDYEGEWGALLKWVQEHVRFVHEPNERIQSPQATLSMGFGDCDDLAVLLASFGHSVRLPFRFVLSGRSRRGERVRWVEGSGAPSKSTKWTHIFVLAQWPPFKPRHGAWAEPTLDVKLGFNLLKDPIPGSRADMNGTELGESFVRRTVRRIPWWTVAGTMFGGIASYYVVRELRRRELRGRSRSGRKRRGKRR